MPIDKINYKCSRCNLMHGYKLWRQKNTFLDHVRLLCCNCAEHDQGIKYTETENNDCIGELVPAIPLSEMCAFWTHGHEPQNRVEWWQNLKTRPEL